MNVEAAKKVVITTVGVLLVIFLARKVPVVGGYVNKALGG